MSRVSLGAGNGGKCLSHASLFPQGTRYCKIGSKREGKGRKQEFLKEKCNQG